MNLELLLSKTTEQLRFLTVTELKTSCKLLDIRGYSKLKKAELLELLIPIHSSVVDRIFETLPTDVESTDKEIIINQQTYEIGSSAHLKKIFQPEPSAELFQAKILERCQQLLLDCQAVYNNNTIVGDMTKKLFGSTSYRVNEVVHTNGSIDNITFHSRPLEDTSSKVKIKETWRDLVKPLRVAIKERYKTKVKLGVSTNYEKVTIDNLKAINWATENLASTSPYTLGLALAILSGRRLVEIFGTAEYQQVGDFIQIKGVAKSKEIGKIGTFIPLCPARDWLYALEALAQYRGLTHEKVKNSIAKLCSRHLKIQLAYLQLKSFKDSRDIYAVTCYKTLFLDERQTEHSTVLKSLLCHGGAEAVDYYKKYDAQPMSELLPLFTRYANEVVAT